MSIFRRVQNLMMCGMMANDKLPSIYAGNHTFSCDEFWFMLGRCRELDMAFQSPKDQIGSIYLELELAG